MELPKIDIIIPTKGQNSKGLTMTTVKSFLRFNDGFDFRIFVVENSNDISYRDELLSLSDSINWIQNPLLNNILLGDYHPDVRCLLGTVPHLSSTEHY